MSTADCKTNKSIVDKIKSATPLEFLSTLFLVVIRLEMSIILGIDDGLRKLRAYIGLCRPYTYNAHQHTAYFSTRTFIYKGGNPCYQVQY